MLKQSFTIVPQGIIKSGSAQYEFDEKTGLGDGSYDILAGVWVFTKELKSSGAFKLDPSLLQSNKIQKGMTLKAGDVVLKVLDIQGSVGVVSIALQNADDQVSGVANIDLSQEYLSLKSAKVSGKALGYDVTLEIQPV